VIRYGRKPLPVLSETTTLTLPPSMNHSGAQVLVIPLIGIV
jgi:hypothetical protein